MKILFMGTPDFAAVSLRALLESTASLVAVVTQPDKKKGRGQTLLPSPVKEVALAADIPVCQPVRLRDEGVAETLASFGADLFVVAAYGQILPEEILHLPPLGCINLHASLLPKYRGAAPIQRSILDGESETGVTIQKMVRKLDAGDILFQEKIPIAETDTGDSLQAKLADLAADMLVRALPLIERGEVCSLPQNEDEATYAAMLDKAMGKIDWSESAEHIDRMVRGLTSWPGAYTYCREKMLKIWACAPVTGSMDDNDAMGAVTSDTAVSGQIVSIGKNDFLVQTGAGLLRILSVQSEGKKRMSVHDFLLGFPLKAGEMLGTKSDG